MGNCLSIEKNDKSFPKTNTDKTIIMKLPISHSFVSLVEGTGALSYWNWKFWIISVELASDLEPLELDLW